MRAQPVATIKQTAQTRHRGMQKLTHESMSAHGTAMPSLRRGVMALQNRVGLAHRDFRTDNGK